METNGKEDGKGKKRITGKKETWREEKKRRGIKRKRMKIPVKKKEESIVTRKALI